GFICFAVLRADCLVILVRSIRSAAMPSRRAVPHFAHAHWHCGGSAVGADPLLHKNDPRRTSGLLASPGAGFTTPSTIIYVRYCTTNTGTLPSTRTSDV